MKKTIIFLAVLFALALFNSSCKKVFYTNEVSGMLIDSITFIPIEGAKISLFLLEPNMSLQPNYGNNVSTVTTGADGKFFFEYKAKRKGRYFFTIEKEGYYGNGHELTERKLFGKKTTDIFFLVPYAYAKIHCKNEHPYDQRDALLTSWFYDGFAGMNVNDTTETMIYHGGRRSNFNAKITWFVTKNGIQTNHSGSFYCPPGDTTLFSIFY